jgi:hypothetical protein
MRRVCEKREQGKKTPGGRCAREGQYCNRKNGNKGVAPKDVFGVVERRLQVADDACDDEVRQDGGQRI